MGFSRQEYWSGLPFPSPGDLPDPGIEPGSPAFQENALTSEPPGHSFLQGIFRYNLNQITHDYTVKVTNKFKGLDLIECLKNYGQRFMTLYRRQESRRSLRKKKCKKEKWLSDEALKIAEKRREAKVKGEKERHTHLNAELQRIARRDKKAFLSDQCKAIEKKQ